MKGQEGGPDTGFRMVVKAVGVLSQTKSICDPKRPVLPSRAQ